jgi:hypothetical protein
VKGRHNVLKLYFHSYCQHNTIHVVYFFSVVQNSQNYVNTNGLFLSCRQTYTMGDRLTVDHCRGLHTPDLTPCDVWLWGTVKERVYCRKICDINDLNDRIRTVVSSIPHEMCPGFKWYCCSLVIVC